MSLALRALLYRERRRLFLVVALAYLAGFLFYLPVPAYLGGVHISLVTGAVYAGVVGLAALVICGFLPSMRYMIEAVAIARVGLALVVLAIPQAGYQLLGNPILTALVVVGGGALVSRVLHGRREKLRTGPKPWHPRAIRLHGTARQRRFVAWVDGGQRAEA